MMNRKISLWGSAGIAVIAFFTALLWGGRDDSSPPALVEASGQSMLSDGERRELLEKVAAVEAAEAAQDEEKVESAQADLAAAIGGRVGKMLTLAMERNLPIEMYGKVVDQHGQPVAGAKVVMVIAGGGELAPGTGLTSYTTDAEGMFQVEAKGQEVSIVRVEHPQLSEALYRTRGGNTRPGAERLTATSHYGEAYSWRTYNSPDNPYVIKVWRVEKFGDVKRRGGGFVPVPNGTPFEYAGLLVSCEREPKEAGKHWRDQKGSWSITFRPIDGGLQETDDLYLNEAPASGYQPELTVAMRRGDADYKVNIHPARRYYYTAYNGKWYGSFEATFEPYMLDDKCLVKADIKYNPNGSRNLAVRPRY